MVDLVGGSNGYTGFDALGNQLGATNKVHFYENINNTNTQGYTLGVQVKIGMLIQML